ncbi:MAG: glutaminyl-peptide cyclotransferase [Candidatus Latescibacteria bacterium]|nr:glutaminyl-peptide cyclotransferase [Candidatus Latescibacterota bacterium]
MTCTLKQIPLFALAIIAVAALGLFSASCSDNGSKPKSNNGGVIHGVPTVLRMIPHDTNAYTQGLLYADSLLYESTGKQMNQSRLRRIDPYPPEEGKVLDTVIAPGYLTFAEGLALKDSQFVQLTWVQKIAFVYTYPGMEVIDTLTYGGQGWGLTNDATRFIMSNGSDTLYFRDDSFDIIRKVNVTLEGEAVSMLNELEYVNGKVWANKYGDDSIYEINPQTGDVTKVIDCSELVALSAPHAGDEVLNGIAYNSDATTYFLTGKNWRYIFEVTIP